MHWKNPKYHQNRFLPLLLWTGRFPFLSQSIWHWKAEKVGMKKHTRCPDNRHYGDLIKWTLQIKTITKNVHQMGSFGCYSREIYVYSFTIIINDQFHLNQFKLKAIKSTNQSNCFARIHIAKWSEFVYPTAINPGYISILRFPYYLLSQEKYSWFQRIYFNYVLLGLVARLTKTLIFFATNGASGSFRLLRTDKKKMCLCAFLYQLCFFLSKWAVYSFAPRINFQAS